MNEKIHIDLFSGIGGFALAAGWAGFRTIAFCEIDPFCKAVLAEHWPGVQIFPDIRTFDGKKIRGATLLSAGVPCQPASVAGKRRGTSDDRWLWPDALRILAEVKPAWAIFENPSGILSLESGLVFENLLSQMEAEGYEVQPVIIPACAVNAPHRRDRVWICGHARELGLPRINGRRTGEEFEDGHPDAPNTESRGRGMLRDPQRKGGLGLFNDQVDASDPERIPERAGLCESQPGGKRGGRPSDLWSEAWPSVATRLCRVDARVSRRVDRLKALGNSIVPQVAYEIIRAIAEIEDGKIKGA